MIRHTLPQAVRDPVRTSHNIHIRSVRHAVRDQWGGFADPLIPALRTRHREGDQAQPARLGYHHHFAEATDSRLCS